MGKEFKDESVTSINQSGGITARNVQINAHVPPRNVYTADLRGALAYILEKRLRIQIGAAIGDSEALQYADQIAGYLQAKGVEVVGDPAVHNITANQPLELFLGESPPLLLVGPRG